MTGEEAADRSIESFFFISGGAAWYVWGGWLGVVGAIVGIFALNIARWLFTKYHFTRRARG